MAQGNIGSANVTMPRQRSMGKMQAGQPGYTELASPDLEIASARAPMTPHTARRRDHMYHLVFDALSVLGLLIVFAGIEKATPREVFLIKETLYKHSYPFRENSVPSWTVPVYSIGACLVACLLWPLIPYQGVRRATWYDSYRCFMAALFAIFLTGAITNCLKVAIGRPRPNFLYQCFPDGQLVFRDENAFGGFALCKDSKHAEEFRKSFPSGHSSWSAAGLGFLSFFLLGQTHAFVGKARAWAFLVSLIPSFGALIVGVTRITDYWHNVSDVCVGLGLGLFVAYVCYVQLFPFFTHDYCHMPRYAISEMRASPSMAFQYAPDSAAPGASPSATRLTTGNVSSVI